jgi:hypothetical protein
MTPVAKYLEFVLHISWELTLFVVAIIFMIALVKLSIDNCYDLIAFIFKVWCWLTVISISLIFPPFVIPVVLYLCFK